MKVLVFILLGLPMYLFSQVQGAYELIGKGDPGEKSILVITDSYCTVAVYNTISNDFIRSYGGAITITPQKISMVLEFDTKDSSQIGNTIDYKYSSNTNSLVLEHTIKVNWNKISENTTALNGCWRITDRLGNDGQLAAMPQGDRKTLKIMSGSRFQWFAINPKTKQFSGTGGGVYTLDNGVYKEKIEFFSRDKTRVGSELTFEAAVNGNKWTHKGKSSTGNAVHEVWTKQ